MGKISVGDAVRVRLELLLEFHSISKAELARRCDLPSRTVENYFKGHAPSAEALFLISKGMRVPVDWLLGDLFIGLEPTSERGDFDPIFECVRAASEELLADYATSLQGNEPATDVSSLARKIAANSRQKMDHITAAYDTQLTREGSIKTT